MKTQQAQVRNILQSQRFSTCNTTFCPYRCFQRQSSTRILRFFVPQCTVTRFGVVPPPLSPRNHLCFAFFFGLPWVVSPQNKWPTRSPPPRKSNGTASYGPYVHGKSNQPSPHNSSSVYAMSSGKQELKEGRKCGRHCVLPLRLIRYVIRVFFTQSMKSKTFTPLWYLSR